MGNSNKRSAFTLIELMVVCSIIIALMAVVISVYPSYNNREQLFRATDLIRNHLARARQWAIRDNAPTGIQLEPMGSNGLGRRMVFLQGQPMIPGQPSILEFAATFTKSSQVTSGQGNKFLKPPTATGPYYVLANGKAFQVDNVDTATDTVTFLEPPGFIGNNINGKFSDFLLLRSPIPLSGEPVIQFFEDKPTIITSIDYNGTARNNIIFNAKGQVEGLTSGFIKITVQQTDSDESSPGGFKVVEESYIYLDVISGTTRVK